MKLLPAWAACFLMIATMVILHRRGDVDKVPPSLPLSQMPISIDHWHGQDEPIAQEALDVLGKGDFLSRQYISPSSPLDQVGLFIGYFATQRTGSSIHSPQHCLPGAGWSFESSGVTDVPTSTGTQQVGDYLISNGTDKAEVLYWYQSQGKAIANDYKAKLDLIANSIRYNRSDAALVRVVTPVWKTETREAARHRAVSFAQYLFPVLPKYIPN